MAPVYKSLISSVINYLLQFFHSVTFMLQFHLKVGKFWQKIIFKPLWVCDFFSLLYILIPLHVLKMCKVTAVLFIHLKSVLLWYFNGKMLLSNVLFAPQLLQPYIKMELLWHSDSRNYLGKVSKKTAALYKALLVTSDDNEIAVLHL